MRCLPRNAGVIAILFALACAPVLCAETYGIDLHGQPIQKLGGADTRLVVLIFAATDCPISNRYIPEIARLNDEFAAKGVRFWWVFPNPEDTTSVVAKHNADFQITEATVLDARQTLVHLAHASVTPEAAVFTTAGGALHEVYRGRIDDRYLSIGQERPRAEHRDLEAAIAAALAGKPVPRPGGMPVGCAVVPLEK